MCELCAASHPRSMCASVCLSILTNLFKIQTFSVYHIHGKKLEGKPCERARRSGMSGRMANPAPNTCKRLHQSNWETCANQVTVKPNSASEESSKTAFSYGESDESTRHRAEASQSQNHEDHVASEGFTSMSHSNLVHKFIPMPPAMTISGRGCSGP